MYTFEQAYNEFHGIVDYETSRSLLIRVNDGPLTSIEDFRQMLYMRLPAIANKFDATKSKNIFPYMVQKIRFAIIDIHRLIVGRNGSSKHVYNKSVLNADQVELFAGEHKSASLKDSIIDDIVDRDFDELHDHVKQNLNPTEREIVRLRIEGYAMKEVGAQLGMSESNVSQIISRMADRVEFSLGQVR